MTKDNVTKEENENMEEDTGNTVSAKDKLAEMENNWKRALADYRNLQKRVAEEKENVIEFSNFVLISRLLPILDNLESMSKHIDDNGIDMIIKEFKKVLMEAGLEEIEVEEGLDFDHGKMEAVEMVGGEEGKVMKVIQKGYTFGDRVVRPVRVTVGAGDPKGS